VIKACVRGTKVVDDVKGSREQAARRTGAYHAGLPRPASAKGITARHGQSRSFGLSFEHHLDAILLSYCD